MKRFLESLKALGVPRLLGIAGVGVVVLGIIGFVALRGVTQPMALLYSDLELRDSAQVAAALDKMHITYQLKDNGTEILVPSDEVDRLRLAMAQDGLPTGGSVGYEVFDRSDSLTSNQFQQQMNQLRALEGELERTIRTIRGVRNARVHLVMAKREPFEREQQEAKASIVIAMAGAQRMGDEEVQAIVNLVSTAVPGLKAQNISVIDSRGELLARPGRTGPDGVGVGGTDPRREVEQRLEASVEEMLGRTFGPGHVRAEATVEMDFDRSHETQELFDPDKQVVRHQQTVTDATKSTEPQASVSVQNNLPNPDTQNGNASGSSGNHQEENITYEIDKTVRTVVHDIPSVKKISMAVLVDGTTTSGPDGKPVWHELSSAELDRIATLVKSAVGYDEKRGDHVDVENMRFATADDLDSAGSASPWLQFGKADLMWLITLGIIALVALFSLGFVVRPIALKLAVGLLPAPAAAANPAVAALAAPQNGLATPLLSNETGGQSALPLAGTAPAITEEKETMLNVANIQGEMRASSLRQLTQKVEDQTDASLMVVRGWLAGKPG
ncbi:MAG TPA: flagellar basal-body MS-ring/collar protein FliF [Rhodopila sp.]|nr:flagellar basal-body MS-ring/collar protein FliF [Rhodopila sp.]